jgi:hypothetical protein
MSRFSVLRQLGARYWSPLGALLGVAAAAAKFIAAQKFDWATGLLIGIGLLFLILARFPRIAVFATNLVLPAEKKPSDRLVFRGLRPYTAADKSVFFGRERDGELCVSRLVSPGFFTLDGESGSGKSSFLNALVVPKLAERFAVVSCAVQQTPMLRLHSALAGKPGVDTPNELDVIEALRKLTDDKARPILLVLDQFEELFLTVPQTARVDFLKLLRVLIETCNLTVIAAIRSDFLDLLLTACRSIDDPQGVMTRAYYPLEAFRSTQAEHVLGQMLVIAEEGDPLQNQALADFATLLVAELLRPPRDLRLPRSDEKTVLPVELQMVGLTAESLSPDELSPQLLRRRGGKAGLLRAFIDSAADYVYRRTAVTRTDALAILVLLASATQTKRPAETATEIAIRSRLNASTIARVLDVFAEQYLVRVVARGAPDASEERAYELMHDHLAKLLYEAPEPFLQKQRDAQVRLTFWTERSGAAPKRSFIGVWLDQPVPIVEALALFRYTSDPAERRLIRGSIRGWLARAGVILLPLIAIATAMQFWTRRDAYQIERMIASAPLGDIPPGNLRDSLTREWSEALATAGRLEAITTAASLNDSNPRWTNRVTVISHVAVIFSETGHYHDALQALKTALGDGPGWRDEYEEPIVAAAKASTRRSEKDELFAIPTTRKAGEAKANYYLAAARGFDAANDVENRWKALDAMEQARGTADAKAQAKLLLAAGKIALNRSDKVRADRLFSAAKGEAWKAGDHTSLVAYAVSVLPYCCEQDAIDAAIRSSHSSENSFRETDGDAYVQLGKELARRNRMDVVERIGGGTSDFREMMLMHLLIGAAAAGADKEALKSSSSLDTQNQWPVLLGVIEKRLADDPRANIEQYAATAERIQWSAFWNTYDERIPYAVAQAFARTGHTRLLARVLAAPFDEDDMDIFAGLLSEGFLDIVESVVRNSCEQLSLVAAARIARDGRKAIVPLPPRCSDDIDPFRDGGSPSEHYWTAIARIDSTLARQLVLRRKDRDRVGLPALARFETTHGRFTAGMELASLVADPARRSKERARVVVSSIDANNPLPFDGRGFTGDDLSRILAAEAMSKARKGQFHEARIDADRLPPVPRVQAYKCILDEYTRRHGSKAQIDHIEWRSYAAVLFFEPTVPLRDVTLAVPTTRP